MKLLVHICCGPCVIEVLRDLRYAVTNDLYGFFYNPNIHPRSEYERRKESFQYYIENFESAEVFYPQYHPQEFFDNVDYKLGFPARCEFCWKLRLEKTAEFAKDNKMDAFTTTLLVSPHQDIDKINDIGKELSCKYELEFISRPFRKLFSKGRKDAKEKGLYRQNYCGCMFSEMEGYNKEIEGLK